MTTDHDPVADAIGDFYEYLDRGSHGEPPSIDHLEGDQRREAQAVIDSIAAGRRLDPTISPPSLERLLADTPFYDAVVGAPTGQDDASEVLMHLETLYPWNVDVRVEEDPLGADPARSYLVIVINGQRLRAQICADVATPAGLRNQTLIESASAVFGRAPETAGVVLVHRDRDLSSVVVDPFDARYCIETPSGELAGPHLRRPILPLADAVRRYLEEIAPPFDPIDLPTNTGRIPLEDLDLSTIAAEHVEAVAAAGRRAQTAAKKSTWSELGDAETAAVTQLIDEAAAGRVDEASLERWVKDLAGTPQ